MLFDGNTKRSKRRLGNGDLLRTNSPPTPPSGHTSCSSSRVAHADGYSHPSADWDLGESSWMYQSVRSRINKFLAGTCGASFLQPKACIKAGDWRLAQQQPAQQLPCTDVRSTVAPDRTGIISFVHRVSSLVNPFSMTSGYSHTCMYRWCTILNVRRWLS
jgi:hypothetical protein